MEKIVNLCKQYGFIFQGSEIYGGLANTWDYGPLGVELKNNIKKIWWKKYVQESINSYGVDAAILMNSKVWEASGHISSFTDPMIDCKECKMRFRADQLFDEEIDEDINEYIKKNKITCPNCGKSNFTDSREFNLMFKTFRGVTEENKDTIYLRPETAQGEYVNFLNVQRTMRAKIPFGIGQIGKVFRNEITPGNFTFRTIEFEQMEYQYFCKDDEIEYGIFKEKEMNFFKNIGIDETKLRFHDHEKLAHYAKAAADIEYEFPFGWGELSGIHNRGTFDLKQHQDLSGKSQEYLDPETNEKYIPNVIESSFGADRLALCVLCDAYEEEKLENETREVMHFHPAIAPYKMAILPLIKKYHSKKAQEVYGLLNKDFMITYDETATIGKRYRRQDVIGTPYCITIDDETVNNNIVTIRDRDTMKQISLDISKIKKYIDEKLKI